MNALVNWLSSHVLTTILIIGTLVSVGWIIAHRKTLFYKE
jgi:hypothetical protein